MTENKADYIAPDTITCACGLVVGRMVSGVDGRVMLQVGPVAVYVLHGYCRCGAQVHFTSGDRLLADILARRERVRKLKSVV